jgi:hypothetical protein
MTNNTTKLQTIVEKQKELEQMIENMKDEVDIVVIKPEYHLICALIKPTPQGYGYSINSVANLFRVNPSIIEGILERYGYPHFLANNPHSRKPLVPDQPSPQGYIQYKASPNQTSKQIMDSRDECYRLIGITKDLEKFLEELK